MFKSHTGDELQTVDAKKKCKHEYSGLNVLRKPTGILQSGVSERAAVTPVLVGQVGPGVVRAHRAVVRRVTQRATVRGCAGGEGPVVLRGPDGVQTVHRVMVVGQAGGRLLVSGVAVAAELQERRFGGIRRD